MPGDTSTQSVSILCLGDIVGRPGRQVVQQKLPALVRDKKVDFVIANSENIAGGSGITTNLFHKVRSYGVDVVTLGDHIYKKVDIVSTLNVSERVVKPANLSANAAGRIYTVVPTNTGVNVAVFSLLGRIFMPLATMTGQSSQQFLNRQVQLFVLFRKLQTRGLQFDDGCGLLRNQRMTSRQAGRQRRRRRRRRILHDSRWHERSRGFRRMQQKE